MSAIVKAFSIFSTFGVGATIPFAQSFLSEEVKLSQWGRPIPKAPVEVPKKESNDGENIIRKAIEQITETTKGTKRGGIGFGCFWAPGFRKLEFLFCFDTEAQETSPFLFHYSWGNGKKVEERLKMVDSIPSSLAVKLKDGGSESISLVIRAQFSWVWKFQPKTFMPSEHCKITNSGKKEDYKLICNTPSDSSYKHEWKKNIPQSQVVKPTIELKQRI